jgi:hypothetical protein
MNTLLMMRRITVNIPAFISLFVGHWLLVIGLTLGGGAAFVKSQ